MTDQRLIECAKALRFEVSCMAIPEQDGYWAVVERPDRYSNLCLVNPARYQTRVEAQDACDQANARACILKWLEQGPTKKMLGATDFGDTYSGPGDEAVYKAMCAQAAKEIAE